MRVSVVNLGCKVNRVESDTIAKAYETRGAQLCSVPDADIVVVNTWHGNRGSRQKDP